MQSDAGITRWSIMVEIEAKDRRLHIASNSSLHNLSITTSRGNTVVYTSGILLPKALSNHPEHMIALCDGQPFLFFPDSPEKTKIKIRTYDGTWHPSRVIKRGTPVSLPGGRGGTLAVLMVEILPGGGREMEWVRTSELRRGMNLLTVSSPFGAIAHETFVNTLSSGIISTILSNGLVVSDARCFPGSQGGAVLTRDGRFIGIIARSFQNTMSAEKGTMTLVVTHQHLSPFLQPHATLPEPKSFSLTPRRLSEPSQAIVSRPSQGNFSESSRGIFSENSGGKFWDNSGGKLLESQVMLMTVGSSWATCFPISCCGYFLTNRHTFDTYLTKHLTLSKMVRARIRITSQQIEPKSCSCRGSTCILPNRWFEPHLVYTPRAGFDLAVLKVDLSAGVNLKCKLRLRRAFESPAHLSLNQKLGTSVRVVGYGIFSPMESQSPMITQGVLSKTFYKPPLENPKERIPVAMATTAPIHQGNSGGIIVDPQGCLLAMVTCNVRTSLSKILPGKEIEILPSKVHPRLNLSIPAAVFANIIRVCNSSIVNQRAIKESLPTFSENIWDFFGSTDIEGEKEDIRTPGPRGSGREKFKKVVERIRKEGRKKEGLRSKL
ncbi:hypothetical protein AAMO2058_001262900 [Amorphochlora amoebiformis]